MFSYGGDVICTLSALFVCPPGLRHKCTTLLYFHCICVNNNINCSCDPFCSCSLWRTIKMVLRL